MSVTTNETNVGRIYYRAGRQKLHLTNHRRGGEKDGNTISARLGIWNLIPRLFWRPDCRPLPACSLRLPEPTSIMLSEMMD